MSARGAGALSGAAAALALPPAGLWPLAFVALVPLGVYLSAPVRTRGEQVRAGLWFAGVFYGVVLHWVPFTLNGMMPFGALLGLLALAVLAMTGGLQTLALGRLLAAGHSPVLTLPAVWVAAEGLLARAGPLAMPWTPLGLSLAGVPALATAAEWGGVSALTLWLALVSGVLVGCYREPAPRRRRLGYLLAALLISGPALAGTVRMRSLPMKDGPPLWVAAFAMSRAELLDPARRELRAGESLSRISSMLRADARGRASGASGEAEARALLLPEAPFVASWGEGTGARILALAEEVGVPVVAGTLVRTGSASGPGAPPLRNGVMFVGTDGSAALVHGKVRLVPGVESAGLAAGPRGGVLRLAGGLSVGFVLCFESAFGRDARELRRAGADVLVNPSNEGWFAPGLPLLGSGAQAQHRAHLVLRAVETRMAALRPSLGGELLALGPDGRVHARRGPGADALERIVPSTSPVTTLYVRYGDLGGLVALVLLFGTGVSPLMRKLSRRRPE